MEKLFGIPMATIMVVLVGLLGLCLLAVAYVALRNRVIFAMGLRNVPRRRAQTALIVIGLMLSTLMISAALATGDTINDSIDNEVYRVFGQVDETVELETGADGSPGSASSLIPLSVLSELERATQW